MNLSEAKDALRIKDVLRAAQREAQKKLGKPADRASVTATSVIMAPLATAVVKDLAAQLDGLRRTRTGAWVVHGRRYRTKALAMASWKARRPRSIAAGLAATVAPFAWGMLQAGVMRIGSAAQKEDA